MHIRNARWLDGRGRFRDGSLALCAGKVFPKPGDRGPRDPEDLDASGLLVLPGLVDAHTHLREPGQRYKEGIANGSRAALAGGVTTLLDMPNNVPPCTTAARLEAKRQHFARKCRVNWGLHLQASRRDPAVDPARIASLKLYMSRASAQAGISDHARLEALLGSWPRICVHAEDESMFPEPQQGLAHHQARPRIAVVAALYKLEQVLRGLPAERRPRLVLCHVGTSQELSWLARMKRDGFDVWGETCPHYCFFTQQDQLERGALLQVNPPLRTAEDRQAVRQALGSGLLDFVSTDHAPHSPDEKAKAGKAPSGIAGIEWLMPLLLRLVDEDVISWERLLQLGSARACACFGIRGRGAIEADHAADLVLVQRSSPRALPVVSRAATRPYGELALDWRVRAVFCNGTLACKDGEFSPINPAHEVMS